MVRLLKMSRGRSTITMVSVLLTTESHYPVNRKKIKAAVVARLAGKIKSNAEVSISIVGDRKMRAINKKYRSLDKTTDVLSFGFSDPSVRSVPFVDHPDRVLRLGDILVSFPQAVTQAREQEKFVDDAIIGLVLHGLDHLLGIHHD